MEAREKRLVFPFSAIVGLEKAKLALLAVAVNPLIGGVLLKGDKGTGKSTLVRALANVLPEIEVVEGCPFNCNPRNPLEMCDNCYERYERGEELPVAKRRMRVVDLPLSVTIDRLVGTIDVETFLKEGRKALQPGILAEANRNVLYIDEVNLLDDYIADALLDAAAMGWNIIEREGVSFRHPARFILVGSMNPEEGELRPQILDRFGLCVEVSAPTNPEDRMEVVRRVEEFHRDPLVFYRKYEKDEKKLTERIARAREILSKVEIDDDLLKLLAETVVKLGIKTNRAEIATVKTAKAIAALDGRRRASLEDLEKAMELALPHRLRDRPFQKPPEAKPPRDEGKKPRGKESRRRGSDREGESGRRSPSTGNLEMKFSPVNAEARKVESEDFGLKEVAGGRSSRDARITVIDFPKGVPVSYVLPLNGKPRDIDLYGSIVWAVLNGKKPPIRLDANDIRVRVRKARAPTLWVLLLDSSGSMAVQRRISIAKGIARKLVENGYVKKSKMALIVAKGNRAEVAVPPTKNYMKVLESIEEVPTGGRTPLGSALYNLLQISERERKKEKSLQVRAFLITDGKANVPLFGRRIRDEIAELAEKLRRNGIQLVVYDTRGPGISPGLSYIPLLERLASAKVLRV